MEEKSNIQISVLKGFKLFNQNTPFVINLFAKEPESPEKETENRTNADLICVIDISGSMSGSKIYHVKESLKILVEMMNKKDRIALVLFESQAELFYDLNYLSEKNKSNLKKLIDKIDTHGGTNIASGLEIAVELLKKYKKSSENRSSSIILLSDGQDNKFNDFQLAEKLKSLTKGQDLFFTLNTFGYGADHDPKIMNRLANIRDGSFFFVEDYTKVGEYFVTVFGGCISTISKNAELTVKLLNKKCKIIKIFGEKNLYSFKKNNNLFSTKMLQFISGKEYTFVLEILIDEFYVIPGVALLEFEFVYEEILTKDSIELKGNYIYRFKDPNFEKANEEYIRSQTYDVIDQSLQLKQENEYNSIKAQNLLKEMEKWLENYYTGEEKSYLEDIKNTKKMLENKTFNEKKVATITNLVSEKITKKAGTSHAYSNWSQRRLVSDYETYSGFSKKHKK